MNLNVIPPKPTARRKTELSEKAEKYKQLIENQVANIKTETIDTGKKVLIIGGACLAVYWLLDTLVLSGDEKPKKKHIKNLGIAETQAPIIVQAEAPRTDEGSPILDAVKGVALSFLLSIAKDKLTEALSHLNTTDASPHS